MKNKGFSNLFLTLGLAILFLAIPLSVNLVQQRQDIRNLAAYPTIDPNICMNECSRSGGADCYTSCGLTPPATPTPLAFIPTPTPAFDVNKCLEECGRSGGGNCRESCGLEMPSPAPTVSPEKCLTDCQNLGVPDIACFEKCGLNFPTPLATMNTMINCPYKTFTECNSSGCPQGKCGTCGDETWGCSVPPASCQTGAEQVDINGCSYSCLKNLWHKDDQNCDCNFPQTFYDNKNNVEKSCNNGKYSFTQCDNGVLSTYSVKQDQPTKISEENCSSGKCFAGACIPKDNFCCENNRAVCGVDSETGNGKLINNCLLGSSCTDGHCSDLVPLNCKNTVLSDGCSYECVPFSSRWNANITSSIFQKVDPSCGSYFGPNNICKNGNQYKITEYVESTGHINITENFLGTCANGCGANGQCALVENLGCELSQKPQFNNNGDFVACSLNKNTNEPTWQKVDFGIDIYLPKGLNNFQIKNFYDQLYEIYKTPMWQKINAKKIIVYDQVQTASGLAESRFAHVGGIYYYDNDLALVKTTSLLNPSNILTTTVVHELAHSFSFCGSECINLMDSWKKTFWINYPDDDSSGIVGATPINPPTEYAKTNKYEDLADSVMLFLYDPGSLLSVSPERYNFIKEQLNNRQDSPNLGKNLFNTESGTTAVGNTSVGSTSPETNYRNVIIVVYPDNSIKSYSTASDFENSLRNEIISKKWKTGQEIYINNFFNQTITVAGNVIKPDERISIIIPATGSN